MTFPPQLVGQLRPVTVTLRRFSSAADVAARHGRLTRAAATSSTAACFIAHPPVSKDSKDTTLRRSFLFPRRVSFRPEPRVKLLSRLADLAHGPGEGPQYHP